ncbi:MAG: hypothetical protein IPN00_13730 [Hydrogenophilales bacterium]|nr:hypothetical protein [Hydrogenophilales bacterium]
MDGKLILVTNMPGPRPPRSSVVPKALADIERGRVLESEIEIAPVFHRLPERIRAWCLDLFPGAGVVSGAAYALKRTTPPTRPERALEIVPGIRFHQVTLHQRQTASGLNSDT